MVLSGRLKTMLPPFVAGTTTASAGNSPHHTAVPEIIVNGVQRIDLVFAQLDTQQNLGVVRRGLEIFGDRALAP